MDRGGLFPLGGAEITGKSDQGRYLSSCALVPPLIQQQSIDNKLELMLG